MDGGGRGLGRVWAWAWAWAWETETKGDEVSRSAVGSLAISLGDEGEI